MTREFQILCLNDVLCAVAKPSGILVHRTPISPDRVFLVDLLREQIGRRVWPVHRLDRATSGVMLFALSTDAAAALGQQFERGEVEKCYLALVRGWLPEHGEIDHPLRDGRGCSAREREALTRFRCLGQAELDVAVAPHATARYSLAEVRPATGRTHQIRRHFNHIAHPIVGDVNHGDRHHNRLFRERYDCHRLLLHASSLGFRHPDSDEWMTIAAEPAPAFGAVLDALGLGLGPIKPASSGPHKQTATNDQPDSDQSTD